MYTICYVVTDNEKLKYFHEMLISVASLRMRGWEAPVKLVTDFPTSQILQSLRSAELKEYQIELVPVALPEKLSSKQRSRYLKTTLREQLSGDYLFVDADTVFAEKPPEVISEAELAMVKDFGVGTTETGRIEVPAHRKKYSEVAQKLGYTGNVLDQSCFNSGVIWARDTERVHAFYRKWHSLWRQCVEFGCNTDQQSLLVANAQSGEMIMPLDYAYNVQVTPLLRGNLDGAFPFSLMRRAIIIHTFNVFSNTNPYLLSRSQIKSQPLSSEIIQSIIRCPKLAFADSLLVPKGTVTYKFIRSKCWKFIQSKYGPLSQLLKSAKARK